MYSNRVDTQAPDRVLRSPVSGVCSSSRVVVLPAACCFGGVSARRRRLHCAAGCCASLLPACCLLLRRRQRAAAASTDSPAGAGFVLRHAGPNAVNTQIPSGSYQLPKESFYVWLQEEHGIKLCFTPEGDLTLANEIVNEQKYLLFTLKYS